VRERWCEEFDMNIVKWGTRLRSKGGLLVISGLLLIIFGLTLATQGSVRDLSGVPISAGVTILLISAFIKIGRRSSQ